MIELPVNREMFGEVHALIVEFPELHYQRYWEADPEHTGRCGTTRCIAGWAVWLTARKLGLVGRKRQEVTPLVLERLVDHFGLTQESLDAGEYFEEMYVASFLVLGAHVLGLSSEQAESLFCDMNDERAVARVKSFAETGADLSLAEQIELFGTAR